jgi:prolyl-tRNA editing enzyme YbaK/EbsC (Cys-tRNA(Pro) deacylase)/predicted kinase
MFVKDEVIGCYGIVGKVSHPILIAMAGLPGTGKSTLARRLAQEMGAVVLDKDRVRSALFPPEEIEYSSHQDDLCFEILYQAASFLLAKNRCVILDGRPFLRAAQVERLVQFSVAASARLVIFLCACPEETARQRLEADAVQGTHPAQNRGFDLYRTIQSQAEPIPYPITWVNTAHNLEECARICREIVNGRGDLQKTSNRLNNTSKEVPEDGGRMTEKLSTSAQKVQDALERMGFHNQVVEHAQTTRSAKEAAAAIGCSVEQIAKSLIFRTRQTHQPVLVIASGVNRVNEAALGELVGEAIERADADFVQQVTGYAIGGVPPIAHRTLLTTLIDADLIAQTEIWAAGGTPNAVFRLTADELLRMTTSQVVRIK